MRPQQRGREPRQKRLVAVGASGALVAALCVLGATTAGASAAPGHHHHGHQNACQLSDGIKHIVQIGFDNVHFFRDNPNVPSDLELMPNLLNFIENNGTLLSNNHTPLIAHTADDLLTTQTGLYGDRQGEPVSNTYQAYNTDGTTDPAESFTYWTDPIDDTASTPNPGHDTKPNLVYSPVPPATARNPVSPTTVTPGPWVPYTRAGCNVGEIATVNQELENANYDIGKVFGANSPEEQQVLNDTADSYYLDPEVADYVGLAVHCARHSEFCAHAEAVKYGQTTPSHTAAADLLPDEPGGYDGFQALFGYKYLAPQLGGGSANATHDGFPVTDSAGYLTDLFGNEIDDPYGNEGNGPAPGFPGYDSINAAQSLGLAADMLENGVQVVNLYMADIHGNQYLPNSPQVPTMGTDCDSAPDALASGTKCYLDQAAYYNDAFGAFFQRLAADGITPKNTLFVISSDEGDHEAGANVGRAIQPTPADCNGVTILCTYPKGSFGELDGNVTGLLAQEEHNTTPFSMENDTAPEFYLTGNPGPDAPSVRGFEHAVAGLTADDPYTGNANEPLTDELADPVEEGILHMVNADPARTPTLAMFANPDYYLNSGSTNCTASGLGGSSCTYQTTGYAWDHGDYAAEIDTNYVGFVGPGVKSLGLDGPAANAGTTSSGPDSGLITVAEDHFPGPWVDETDIRPTIMYLTGLRDDYEHDGRVITQILTDPNSALRAPGVTALGECYKQLNSSVGTFAADTLTASTNAIESNSTGDSVYLSVDSQLKGLEYARDHVAGQIKGDLEAAAFAGRHVHDVSGLLGACQGLIYRAHQLASSS
ncbi:MAG TPA: hypothetical protein VK823_22185 [Streptosporangiaceae bacterium]|nr:hypothetical protein [Streptosporangiaceae bacterium]